MLLRLYVDSQGKLIPDSTRIAESSGYPALDSAAVERRAGAAVLAGAPERPPGRRRRSSSRCTSATRARGAPRHDPSATPSRTTRSSTRSAGLRSSGWPGSARGIRTPIFGKAEYANPGGSVKDRIGLAIIEDAERRGDLRPGGTIVEGTSGNTGVGLAIAASLKGYRCIFTMPDKMSQEKVRLLKAYGAEVVITPTAVPPDHPDNYVMKAKQIVKETPGAVLANQFYNEINPEAHYATTGPEIWEQTGGKVTHFVAGAGTGGTVSGAGKYLKEKNPKIRVIAGDPIGSLYTHYHRTKDLGEGHPYKVEGIGGDKIPTTHLVRLDRRVPASP